MLDGAGRGWTVLEQAPYLDDGVGERVGDDVEQLGGVVARLDVERVDEELGELEEDAGGHLQGQQDQHRQPVEEVVNGGTGKRPEERRAAFKTSGREETPKIFAVG